MKMDVRNQMELSFLSLSQNEAFARAVVAAFAAQLNPTLEELADMKTAVSEAVTNAIIHGYEQRPGRVYLTAELGEEALMVEVRDEGRGIEDIEQARQPLYTSKPQLERSGMGFTVMESFCDSVEVESRPGFGTRVRLYKRMGAACGV